MIYTKSILKEKTPRDGIRISVMSRHTLEDGATVDSRINPSCFDEHIRVVAPPAKLIGDYYKRGLSWENFEMRYLEYLRKPEVAKAVKQLAVRAIHQDITLLCIEEKAEHCHRRLLAEELQRYEPSLQIIHK